MDATKSLFIRAKHWQLFLLFAIFFIVGTGALLVTIVSSPERALGRPWPFFAAMELLALSLAAWQWSVGDFLNSTVPLPFRMKPTLFRVTVLFVPLYLPVFIVFLENLNHWRSAALILLSFAIIIPMHLFAFCCQIYSWYFVSKAIVLAENPRPVSFTDYVGYFFAVWLFPVGVWIIQPRINRLYKPTLHEQPQ